MSDCDKIHFTGKLANEQLKYFNNVFPLQSQIRMEGKGSVTITT